MFSKKTKTHEMKNGIPKLKWNEKQELKKLIAGLTHIRKKIEEELEIKKQKEAIAKAIMEVNEILDITNPDTEEPATEETLKKLDLDDLIMLFEEVIQELNKAI